VSTGGKVFTASQLPENPGVCGWVAMLPPRAVTAPLADATTADITVIGAGFAGLSAARRLAQIDPTLRVAVLEAGVVGDGPAGRNSGFIIDLPHEVSSEDYGGDSLQKAREHIALQRRAVTFATDLAAERGWGPETLDACGRYNLALTAEGDQHIADYAAQLVRLGEAHTVLDAEAIADVTGSRAFTSGVYMPGTLIVQPAGYVRGLADSLRQPVRLFERTPAVSFERRGGGWLIRTPKGSVESPRIVLANNGYAERFGFFRGRLLHVFTYASMTEAFDPARLGGRRTWAATPASPMGTTLRRIQGRGGDRLLVRSRYTYNPSLHVGEGTLRRAGARHDAKLAHRFPPLKGIRMEYRWGGAMALTRNSVPAFGEVEAGVLAACGCNGLGASNATASGLAAAETLAGVESELTRIYRGFASPQALPPQPLTLIGARATLALREWKAGIE
jgi:glycine/D-amino acid oxidase-like deaminating enzyme